MDSTAAPVLEVFASYQGEGLFVGQPQTFLRLAGCPLRCRYCDTAHSWTVPERSDENNWLTPFGAMLQVAKVEYDGARPIAVTGGEPLIWMEFLAGLPSVAGDRPLHLETSGHDMDSFEAAVELFDHISLDLKLAADLAAPVALNGHGGSLPKDASDWDGLRARQLERLSRSEVSACAKLVVTEGSTVNDFQPILDDLVRLAPDLPLFIAPASPQRGTGFGDLTSLREVTQTALDAGLEPRVLPQMHRSLGVR